jgi:hypothetical protein
MSTRFNRRSTGSAAETKRPPEALTNGSTPWGNALGLACEPIVGCAPTPLTCAGSSGPLAEQPGVPLR